MTDKKDYMVRMSALIQQLIQEDRYEELAPILKEMQSKAKDSETKNAILETTNYLTELKERIAGKVNDSIIPTGFEDIDKRIFGAVKGNIMTICARTGGGKTTLGINIALNMLKKHKVGFISLEMTEQEMGDKIVARIGDIRLSSLTINKFADREKENIKNKAQEIKYAIDNLIRAYDCYNIEEIAEVVNEMTQRGCEVVFVDWLGMIEAPGVSKPEQIRTIMTTLKQLAISNNIAIVTMQQLNRQMDGTSREPYMYDIADGSAIEKISSPVLIMWKYEEGITDISIYKARRLNSDAFIRDDGKLDWDSATTLRLKDKLGYGGFMSIPKQENPF